MCHRTGSVSRDITPSFWKVRKTLYACPAEAGTTDALLPAIPILLELSSHAEAAVACTAAQCLVILMEMFPQDAAAGILSGDGLLMLADALQPSQGSPADEGSSASSASQDTGEGFGGQEAAEADCARQQQLLTCLAAACQFQPPVNIMAGMCPVGRQSCDTSIGHL